jgi:hypothetical protein
MTLHQLRSEQIEVRSEQMSTKTKPAPPKPVTFDHGGYTVTLNQIKGVNRGQYTTAVASQEGQESRLKLYAYGATLIQATEQIKRLIDENQLVPAGVVNQLNQGPNSALK